MINFYHSPLGPLKIVNDNSHIVGLTWCDEPNDHIVNYYNELFAQASKWLDDYFSGKAAKTDLPFKLKGTDFQRRVWAQMLTISAGETLTYGEVAQRLNSSARAVGGACRVNPVVILVPCHRIIAATGIGGYAGKIAGVMIDRKTQLLSYDQGLSH